MLSNHLRHFIDLAAAGTRVGSSGGQDAAATLAYAVLEVAHRLDGSARLCLAEFVELVATSPCAARDLFEEAIHDDA